MKSLAYLMLATWKNTLKETLHRPSRLILVAIIVGFTAISFISNTRIQVNIGTLRDAAELRAMVLLLYCATFMMGSWRGLASGATFYSMADVRMLFPSPLAPKKILLYGLIRQAGTSLMLAFVLVYQYAWLHNLYGLSMPHLVLILLGFGLCFFCSQLTAMIIYSYTSPDEARQRRIKALLLIIAALFAAYLAYRAFRGDSLLAGAVDGADSLVMGLFPVGGWLKLAVGGMMAGSMADMAIGLSLTAGAVLLLLVMLLRSRSDFYEDVLQATEVSFTAITAKKEGRLVDQVPKNIKIGRVGIAKGFGPSVFFYKHMLENRRSRLLIFDNTTLIFMAITIGMALITREMGIVWIFAFSTYMQIFSVTTGRWVRELLLPYVYMIPSGAFKKLMGVCAESLLKTVAEAVVLYIPVGIIMGLTPLGIISCIAARIGFGLLFLAGNILIERVLGSLQSKVIILMLYFLIIMALCIPGVIVGVVIVMFLPDFGISAAFFSTFVWNALLSLLIIFLCRDILNVAELNNR